MKHKDIVAFLGYPDNELVMLAVKRANLTRREWEVIQLRINDGETIESAAERLDVSPGTIKLRYKAGMSKLEKCWDGIPWIVLLRK